MKSFSLFTALSVLDTLWAIALKTNSKLVTCLV